MPVPPAPTPKTTKLSAKTIASMRKTHFAFRRSFVKKRVCSTARAWPLARMPEPP